MKKFAFTLAEVLITLTIIGVVSAMVLPNMLGHWEKRALETQTKHFYSMLSLAIQNYMADNRVDDLRDSPMYCEAYELGSGCERAKKEVDEFVTQYLKVAIRCIDNPNDMYLGHNNKCEKIKSKVLDKTSSSHGEILPDYILTHGYAIRMYGGPADMYGPLMITVDVNGYKGPNRGGRDIWTLDVYYDGTINDVNLTPECIQEEYCGGPSSPEETINERFEHCKEFSYDGNGCFAHFKDNNFKFDY